MMLLTLAAQAAAQTASPTGTPPAPPPPPIAISHLPVQATPAFTRWEAALIRCDGKPVTVVRAPYTYPRTAYYGTLPRPISLAFTIDASGRPLDVAREGEGSQSDLGDLGPALAAAQFAPDAPRSGCRATFNPLRTPLAEAPPALLMEYSVFPDQRPTKPLLDRLRPAGSTCFDPPPAVLVRRFPDFDKLPKQPGTSGWSMVGFDIDARGRPIGVRTVAGGGSVALDAASREAVAGSRFSEGSPRKGCLFPYWQRGADIAPPPAPEEAAFRTPAATCPAKADWATAPSLTYPQTYRRRGIEGWAVVTYDVAPWGEVGNLKIAAVQPAADFGDQALRVLRSARRASSATGYTGCVDRVIFRLAKPGEDGIGEPPPPF